VSSVNRTSGVLGTFPYTLSIAPFSAPSLTVYSDAARTLVAVAPATLVATGDPRVFTATYPASLPAGTYYLKFSTVITFGQPALIDSDDTLVLSAVLGDVGADRDILTLAEAKQALNLPSGASSVDAELAQVITAASLFVDSIDGAVVQRTVTETFRNPRGSSIILATYPVVVTSVAEYSGGVASTLTAESNTVAGGFTFESSSGILSRRSSWYATAFTGETLVVTYTAGRYATTATVDALYKEAAVHALIHYWQVHGSGSGVGVLGGDGERFGGVPYATTQLRRQLQAMLKPDSTPAIA